MKKYLSLTLFVITILFFSYTHQSYALMACHTWNPNEFWNDVVSLTMVDCCDFYPEFNPSCSTWLGSCKTTNDCFKFMDSTECNMEWWTWFSSNICTNTQPSTTWCTIENGTGKEITNYGKHWAPYWEAIASDINWVDTCNPMPIAWTSCANILDSCKKDNVTTRYLECERYDLWTTSCAVDTCNPWFVQDWNKCVAWPEKGVCSTTSQSCTTWNYVDVTNTATEYKWQCSGLNWGQNTACSLNIPVTPQAWTCSATHYGCTLWTSTNNINGSTQWTWDCQWTNWWATTSCTEDKDLTVVPPVVLGDWPINWATSSANDDSKFAWMSNETKYVLEWCTPHKIELDWPHAVECMSKYFTNEWGKAVLPINGWTDNLLSITDNMWFEIKWEWVLYIHTFATDYADNISIKKFIYKVDKTAPRFWDFVFTEISGNQYMNVENYDIAEDGQPSSLGVLHMSTQDDGYTFPLTNTYTKTSNTENPYTQNISEISKVRYKQSWLWATSPVINVALSWATDTFWWIAHFNYVSRADRIDFYKWNTVAWWPSDYHDSTTIDLTQLLTNQKELNINTFDLSKGWTPASKLTWNDGTFINVRLTDNAWNYSEKAFYVYRDEAVPLVWDIKLDFTWDWNANKLKLPWKTESRYVLANTDTNIDYNWWAWNDHMATWITMLVEDIDNTWLNQIINLGQATNGTSLPDINLSKIDNDLKNNNTWENYRNYEVQFRTPGINWNKICDAAGNCIDWNTVLSAFRAIAENISKSKSDLNINSINAGPILAWNYRNIWANWYKMNYSLKDIYWNAIRQIYDEDNVQVRKNSSIIWFENWLNEKQVDLDYTQIGLWYSTSSYSWAVLVKDMDGNELINPTAWNELELDDKLELSEVNNNSNWIFNTTIYSALPTVWGYKYMKDSAMLILNKIENTVVDNPARVYNWVGIAKTDIDYTWATNGKYFSITNNITEDINNRFNLTANSLDDYGKLNPANSSYSKDLTFANDEINLEYWSPIIYDAENFNILRDGIDSEHDKNFTELISSTYRLYERYFDASQTLWSTYSSSDNDNASFYIDEVLENQFIETSTNDDSYKVQYKAEQWKNFDTWWYVSYLKYQVDWVWFNIPSISRWVSGLWNDLKASAYYPTNISASWGISHLTQDIAITWLVNKVDGLSNNWPQIWLSSLDLERPYTRAELLEKLKKKIFTVNKVGNWCSWSTTALNESVWNSTSCTFDLNWEIVSFYEWDVEISCETTCNVTDKRTLIVKDWRVTIKSNINTNNISGQLLIASITDKWLSNVNLSLDYSNKNKQKWWIAIDENVTNIDAFLLAQWPLVSSHGINNDEIMTQFNNPNKLLNQLHIYGSVFSLNTIWGENINKCPYIETSCTQDIAKIYDLSFLRRYALVDAIQFNWISWIVPFDPDLDFSIDTKTKAKSSGWLQYKNDWNPSWSTTLRTAKSDHLAAPVIVERNNKWSTSPSYFAQD